MFKLVDSYTVCRDFDIEIPVKGKSYQKGTLTLEVELLPLADVRKMVEEGLDDVDLLKKVIVGWPVSDRIQDADGQPQAFDEEALERLVKLPFLTQPLVRQYMELITRGPKKT